MAVPNFGNTHIILIKTNELILSTFMLFDD